MDNFNKAGLRCTSLSAWCLPFSGTLWLVLNSAIPHCSSEIALFRVRNLLLLYVLGCVNQDLMNNSNRKHLSDNQTYFPVRKPVLWKPHASLLASSVVQWHEGSLDDWLHDTWSNFWSNVVKIPGSSSWEIRQLLNGELTVLDTCSRHQTVYSCGWKVEPVPCFNLLFPSYLCFSYKWHQFLL